MGPVPWDRRRAAFEAARLGVMTSRVEPFGMVALEAMTYGVPVMFPGHAGIAEVVSAGEHIDPDDTDDTARRVVRLVNDEDLLSAMVKQQDEEIDRYAASAPELELVRALEDVLAGQR